MKDLLEVIESGRVEGLSNIPFSTQLAYEENGKPTCSVDLRETVKFFEDRLTSYTKAILTNQIERMKESQFNHREGTCCNCHCKRHDQALQTQIDYLEIVLKKLN